MRYLGLFFCLALLGEACTSNEKQGQEKLRELFKREAKLKGKDFESSFSGGLLKLVVRAPTRPKPILNHTIQGIEINIGTRSPVRCFVSELSLPGTNISNIMASVDSNTSINSLKKPVAEVLFAQNRPVLVVGAYYQTQDRLLGDFKIAHIMLDDHSINCTHDEPGYRETFKQLAINIAKSAKESLSHFTLIKKDLFRVSVEDNTIGFIHEQRAKKDGKELLISYQSLLLPAVDDALRTVDSQSITRLLPGEKIQGAELLEYVNNEQQYALSYEYRADKQYVFTGIKDGTSIDNRVSAKDPILTEEAQVKKALLAGKRSLSMQTYSPESAVDNFTSIAVEMTKGKSKGVMTWGEREVKFTLDKNYELLEQSIPQGDALIKVERLR